jgi:putative phage-type endonuclease
MLTDEQRERRRKTIGASDAPIVMGISPWSSQRELWLEKAGFDSQEETQSTRLGNYLQYGVAMEALKQIGGNILLEEPFLQHADGWASATPDYIIGQGDDRAILEIKTTHQRSWDIVPEHYLLQVNWQAWVAGIDRAYLACLHGEGLKVAIYEITPSLQSSWFINAVRECKRFWERYIQGNEEVPKDAKTAESEELKAAIRAESGKSVDLDIETLGYLRKLAELKRRNAPAADEIAVLEKLVKNRLDAAEVGLYSGQTVVTWKESVSNSFDSARFKTDYPDLAKQYTKQTISRRFLPKEDAILSLTSISQDTEYVSN